MHHIAKAQTFRVVSVVLFKLEVFAKPQEKSHEKNFNCFGRYDGLFKIKNCFQILVLGTPEGYPALENFHGISL